MDEEKNRANRRKHGVDFGFVHRFDFEGAIIESDARRDYGEARFIARGFTDDGYGYHLAFTMRGPRLRVISMRRFNSREYRRYGR